MAKHDLNGARERDASDARATNDGKGGWRFQLHEIINANVGVRVNGRVSSNRTQQQNRDVLDLMFRTLHNELNLAVYPHNLREKHIAAIVHYWIQQGKAPRTIKNDFSVIGKFCTWINKPQLKKSLAEYLPQGVDVAQLKIVNAAEQSKSWTAAGIDVEKKLAEAFEIDFRFGLMVSMQLAFGLRRKEALNIRPWVSDLRDQGQNGFMIYRDSGGKGGRERLIPLEFGFQVRILDTVKARISKRAYLGWDKDSYGRKSNLEKNLGRYKYLMKKLGIGKEACGVVGHGLRAEYAENCAILEGFIPGSLGGTEGQMSAEDQRNALIRVSKRLGHNRPQVTASYFGKLKKKPDAGDGSAPPATGGEGGAGSGVRASLATLNLPVPAEPSRAATDDLSAQREVASAEKAPLDGRLLGTGFFGKFRTRKSVSAGKRATDVPAVGSGRGARNPTDAASSANDVPATHSQSKSTQNPAGSEVGGAGMKATQPAGVERSVPASLIETLGCTYYDAAPRPRPETPSVESAQQHSFAEDRSARAPKPVAKLKEVRDLPAIDPRQLRLPLKPPQL
ncbi:site-specific integrase [Burkholderia sp. Ac-20365]|uniref:site-specific integrase n=1 Tax=Burkholderia sp. Ac-20365 TaxID=2703897 RepID=UPI00197CA192|nr:site-specific integrase [Burkholderia sp. Ac-20365]MBN3761086.1 hypothetical protein [Burkholderia sp. Ac-20365]